jgi:para-nitrobenzyl esterase
MVWVHGGSNTVGQGASYDGSHLATTEHVVVVTINYRLGPFGWFILPSGRTDAGPAPDPLAASGNWGILDELAALRWVQAHIAAFGGDAGNVTVFGESAGATDALALLVSPLSTGLLHRLVVQSLGFGFAAPARATHYVDDAEAGGVFSSGEILLKALVHAGRAADRAEAKALVATLGREEIASFLRGLDPWELYALYHPSNIETDLFPTVFQDGAVVRTGDLEQLLADPARHLAVPTLFGTNRDEPKLFMAFDPRLVGKVGGAPLWIRDPAAYEREAEYRARLWRANGVDRPARALASAGTPVFAYRWDWREEGRRFGVVDAGRLLGAAHGLEIPFVFGSFDSAPGHELLFTADNRAGRIELSDAMMSYWAEFASHGKPGRGRDGALLEWPAWGAAEPPSYLVFDTAAHGGIRTGNEVSSREAVVASMESREPTGVAACAMFRATFRTRVDAWADDAWRVFRRGECAAAAGAQRMAP